MGSSIYTQSSQCSLSLASLPQAPELAGFQLGMTKEQVKVRVPQVVFGRKDEFGVSKTTINPYFDPRMDQSSFTGIRTISLDFLDDRLTSLWIGYDSSYNVNSVEQFVKKISQSLRLPDSWKPWRSRGQQLNCVDFQLIVTMVGGGPSFRIHDVAAQEVLATRRETKAEPHNTAAASEEPVEVIGDKRNRIYYLASCPSATKIANEDRLVFKNSEEADKAGFKPVKDCP
jgi:hypothetical protein